MTPQDEILEQTRGFLKSRVILTGAELDLFTNLHDRQKSAEELCEALQLDVRATTRLLDCLITFGLLEKHDGRYQTSAKGSVLSSRHPETVLPMVLHLKHLWENWSHLTDAVKTGINEQRKPITSGDEKDLKAFIGAMHVVGRQLAEEVAAGYDLAPFRKLLDIGGGSGTYTIAFLRKNPQLTATVFDLDKVIPLTRDRLQSEGLQERVQLAAGNFYEDELPSGNDLALLSAIIHQNSPPQNVALYEKIHRALVPGGVLLIRDHIMDEDRTSPPAGALFALNMLANTAGGDTYTFSEVRETLHKAGFTEVRQVQAGARMDCLVEARKPA